MAPHALINADLLQVRTPWVCFYVLRDREGLYLVDTGFIGGRAALEAALADHGWSDRPLLGIVLTHGHLDHILNAAPLARRTGAWIAAPLGDAAHCAGRPRYRGWGRLTGSGEAIGRRLLGFEPFVPSRWVTDGDLLPIWGGLQAIHLPGHTRGHTVYYHASRRLLFSGDLFASYRGWSHCPPGLFNHDGEALRMSLSRALSLGARGVLPHHADRATPEVHRERLRQLAEREGVR